MWLEAVSNYCSLQYTTELLMMRFSGPTFYTFLNKSLLIKFTKICCNYYCHFWLVLFLYRNILFTKVKNILISRNKEENFTPKKCCIDYSSLEKAIGKKSVFSQQAWFLSKKLLYKHHLLGTQAIWIVPAVYVWAIERKKKKKNIHNLEIIFNINSPKAICKNT